MRLKTRPVLLLGPLALAAVLTAAALAAPPNGDPQAIAYYQQQVRSFSTLKGAVIKESGYMSAIRRGAAVTYIYGEPKPAGYVATPDTVVYQLNGDAIKAYLISARGVGVSYRLLFSGGKFYINVGACWQHQPLSAAPHGHGGRFLSIDNATVQPQPNAHKVVSSYAWGKTATATETDLFNGQSPPGIATVIKISGGLSFTFHQKTAPLPAAPKLPLPRPVCR